MVLTLHCEAKDDEALLRFVDNLFAHPAFSEPNLENEEREDSGLLRFDLTVQYQPNAPTDPTTLASGTRRRTTRTTRPAGATHRTGATRPTETVETLRVLPPAPGTQGVAAPTGGGTGGTGAAATPPPAARAWRRLAGRGRPGAGGAAAAVARRGRTARAGGTRSAGAAAAVGARGSAGDQRAASASPATPGAVARSREPASFRSSGGGRPAMIGARGDIWHQRLWVWAAALAFVALNGIGLLVYLFAYSDRVKTLEVDLRDQGKRQADVHAAHLHSEDLLRQARVNRERILELYDEHFSTRRRRLTGVTAEVKDLAKRAGLVPRSITYPEEQIQQYGLIKRSFIFSVDGTYADLRKFINLLELSDSFLTLEDASLAEAGQRRDGASRSGFSPPAAFSQPAAAARPGVPGVPGVPVPAPVPMAAAPGAGPVLPHGALRMGLTISTLFSSQDQPRDVLAPLPGAKADDGAVRPRCAARGAWKDAAAMKQRQKVLLGVLVVLLLILAWVYLVPGDDAPPPPPAVGRGAGAVDADAGVAAAPALARAPAGAFGVVSASDAAQQSVEPLRLAALSHVPPGFTTGRDPWRFVEPPPPPPPKPRVPSAAELRALREAEEARQRQLAELARLKAIDDATPKPPPFTWSYLGNFGPSSQRIAVFTDGKRVWNARQGETLENKFIVAQIGYESVDIRFVGFPDVPAARLAVKH